MDHAAGGSRSLLRLLDNFTIHELGKPDLLVTLDSLKHPQVTAVATGEVLQPSTSGPLLPPADGGG